jgi:hypothetical protein
MPENSARPLAVVVIFMMRLNAMARKESSIVVEGFALARGFGLDFMWVLAFAVGRCPDRTADCRADDADCDPVAKMHRDKENQSLISVVGIVDICESLYQGGFRPVQTPEDLVCKRPSLERPP